MKPSRPYHSFTAYHREPGGLRRIDFFVDRLEAWRGERTRSSVRVLDVGCGNGNIALALAGAGYTVTGVDYDETSIARARRSAEDLKLNAATFVAGSFNVLSEQIFDAIIASEVLEHQTDPAKFLAEVATHLAPGGVLLLSVPNGKSLEERIRKFTTHNAFGLWLKTHLKRVIPHQGVQSSASHPHEQFFSLRELQQTLVSEGWRIEDLRQGAAIFKEFYYLVGRLFMRRGGLIFHALDRIDAALASYLPLPMSDGWLIEVRRFDPTRTRVLQILPTLSSGGAERFVYDLSKRLPAQGFDVHVISIIRGGPLESLFRAAGPLTILGVKGPFGLTAFRELYRLMRRERPEIVHTHLYGVADVWGRIAAKLAGVPLIFSTEHNINLDHGRIKRLVKGWLTSITTHFVAPAAAVREYMSAYEYIPAKKVSVIPYGTDVSRVVVRPARGFHDVPRFLTVGRLVEQKAQSILLKALALVKGPWTLEIVGTGELENELHELAERLGIAPRIHWLGFRADVSQRLAETDIFFFPSRWEGLGLALLEAAAAGVPCIASDLPVFHEFLTPQEIVYAPVGDVPALAQATEQMLRDPFPAIERVRVAGERLRATASVDVAAAAYAALYRKYLTRV